jgi:UTP--glucose-1-phosphate uridylyltransferase
MTQLHTLCGTATQGVHLRDAIALLLRHETVLAWSIDGIHYDCSTKLGYLKAMLAFGLAHPELGDALARHVETLAKGIRPCVESSALSHSAT